MKSGNRHDYDYFQYFIECGQMALDAAQYLYKVFESFDVAHVPANVEEMHHIENNADMKKHDMLLRLAHEFITPIEREDIVALSQQMDNVVDAIDEVMLRIHMFDIESLRQDALQMAGLIEKCCEELLAVVRDFPQFKKSKTIKSHIIAVNTIESDGDKLHAHCMRNLFTSNTELREVVTWMTMYECLENCLDACEDAADIIEGVIMKNT